MHARQLAHQHAMSALQTVSVPVHTIADNEITDSSVLVRLRHEYHYSVVVTKECPVQEMVTSLPPTMINVQMIMQKVPHGLLTLTSSC